MHISRILDALSTAGRCPIKAFLVRIVWWYIGDGNSQHLLHWGEAMADSVHRRQLTFMTAPAIMGQSYANRGGAFVPTQTQTRQEPEVDIGTGLHRPWVVLLFNDEFHTFDAVVAQVQKATGCSPGEAFQITYAAHTNGQAVAYVGEKPQCEEVAKVLREIDLHVELEEA
jgi:ATP-dependent Clp protease adaptor protein ClpS